MASLTTLPTELLLEIYYRLYPLDKHNLILTSRYFRNHLGSLVLTREETVEELKRFEHVSSASSAQSQILLARCPRLTPQAYRIPHKYCQLHAVSISLGTPYKRVCETCLRLRQFFHFSHPQAGKRTGKRTKRCCIDCQEECARRTKSRFERVNWVFGFDGAFRICQQCFRSVRCHVIKTEPGLYFESSQLLPHGCAADIDDGFKTFDFWYGLATYLTPPAPRPSPKPITSGMVYISDLRKRMDALEKVLPPFYLSQFRTTAGGLRSLRPELSFQNKDIDELDHFLCVLERAAITDIVEYASKKKELNGNADCEALAELSRIYQYLLYTTL